MNKPHNNTKGDRGAYYRIPAWEAVMMLIIAGIFDIAQIVLVAVLGWIGGVGFIAPWIFTVLGGLIFGVWFTVKGASIINGRRATSFGLGAIIEAIPGLNALPGWTVAVGLALTATRAEDMGLKLPTVKI